MSSASNFLQHCSCDLVIQLPFSFRRHILRLGSVAFETSNSIYCIA